MKAQLRRTNHILRYSLRLGTNREQAGSTLRKILATRLESYYAQNGERNTELDQGVLDAVGKNSLSFLFGEEHNDECWSKIVESSKSSIRDMIMLTKEIIESHFEDLNESEQPDWQAPIPLDTVERVCSQWH
ncbi:hypothetical protein HC928_09100 [bacterium]|nr:hypothetical protein [bacterium]